MLLFLKCEDYTRAPCIQSTSYRPSSEELREESTSARRCYLLWRRSRLLRQGSCYLWRSRVRSRLLRQGSCYLLWRSRVRSRLLRQGSCYLLWRRSRLLRQGSCDFLLSDVIDFCLRTLRSDSFGGTSRSIEDGLACSLRGRTRHPLRSSFGYMRDGLC